MELIENQASSKTPVQAVGREGCFVRVLRTAEEVEEVREFWTSTHGTRDSDIEILLSLCRSETERRKPHVFVLYRNGEPVALITGSIVQKRLHLGVGYLRLFRPLALVLEVPYGGLRGDASVENCESLVRGIIDSLKRGEAEVAILDNLDIESAFFRCARRLPTLLCRDHILKANPLRMRMLPASVELLQKELSGNERHNFRRVAKALERDFPGQLVLERFKEPVDLDRIVLEVEAIAKTTWQRGLGVGFEPSLAVISKLRTAAERGWLRIYILRLGGKPCAFWVGALYQDVFYGDFTGYDPLYLKYAPGMYMLARMLEEFCASNVAAWDFASGNEDFKKRFGNRVQQVAELHIYAPSFKGLSLAAMKLIVTAVHEALRWLLDRLKLTQRVKRIWRQTPEVKGTA